MTDLNTQGFLGAGDLYIDWLDQDGTPNGFDFAGNATALAIQPNAEVKENQGKGRDTYGQVIDTATINQPSSLSLSLNQLNMKTIAMNLLGSLSDVDVAAASVSDEEVTIASLDKFFKLDQRLIDVDTGLTVNRKAGATASAWASETAYEVGDYCVPGSSNDHFYKVTEISTDGISGTTEPSWPTDGTTVTDGNVTWKDMGLIAAVKDTDFEIVSRNGTIKALSDGDIEAAEVLQVSYDYAAVTGLKVLGAVQPSIKARIYLDGVNLVTGYDVEIYVWEVQLKPDSAFDILADDFNALELSGTPKTPTGYDAPYQIIQYAA